MNDKLLKIRMNPLLQEITDTTIYAKRLYKAWVGWASLRIYNKLKG